MVRWLLACLLPLMRSSSSSLDARAGDLAERLKTDVRLPNYIGSMQSQLACQAWHGVQKTKSSFMGWHGSRDKSVCLCHIHYGAATVWPH